MVNFVEQLDSLSNSDLPTSKRFGSYSIRRLFIGNPSEHWMTLSLPSATSQTLFDAYDRFLALIDYRDKRSILKSIKSTDAQSNPVFNEARDISHDFEEALTRFFFDNENLEPLTRKYGVF